MSSGDVGLLGNYHPVDQPMDQDVPTERGETEHLVAGNSDDNSRNKCAMRGGLVALLFVVATAVAFMVLKTPEGIDDWDEVKGFLVQISDQKTNSSTKTNGTAGTTTAALSYVTFVTAETRGDPLLKSVGNFTTHFKQDIVNIGLGHQWHDYKTKVELLQKWLAERADREAKRDTAKHGQEIIAFVDGSDVFWGGCKYQEFMDSYHEIVRKSGAKIVFSAEVVCGEQDCNKVPEVPVWADEMGGNRNLSGGFWKKFAVGCKGTWNDECSAKRDCGFYAPCSVPPAVKFLNSGFFMGPVQELKDMLDWTLENYANTSVWGDQSSFAVYWLEHQANITLDYAADLALSLSDMSWDLMQVDQDEHVVRNAAFNRTQCLIHGNGRGIFFMKHLLNVLTHKEFKQVRGW